MSMPQNNWEQKIRDELYFLSQDGYGALWREDKTKSILEIVSSLVEQTKKEERVKTLLEITENIHSRIIEKEIVVAITKEYEAIDYTKIYEIEILKNIKAGTILRFDTETEKIVKISRPIPNTSSF